MYIYRVFPTGGNVGRVPPPAKNLLISTHLEKIPPSRLPPPLSNNFQVITQLKQYFYLQSLLWLHFYFNFILFGHTGHVNFDFN